MELGREACIENDQPIPDSFYPPDLDPSLEFIRAAYNDLSTTRQFELGAIPWTAAVQYFMYKKVPPDDIEYYWSVIQIVDAKYREHVVKKNQPKPSGGGK